MLSHQHWPYPVMRTAFVVAMAYAPSVRAQAPLLLKDSAAYELALKAEDEEPVEQTDASVPVRQSSLSLRQAPLALTQTPLLLAAPVLTRRSGLRWNQEWTEAGPGHVTLAGAMGAIAVAGLFVSPNRTDGWTRGFVGDRIARNMLRLPTPGGRVVARRASDVLVGLLVAQPASDALLNAWWGQGNSKVAWELTVINAEVMAVTAALVTTSKWHFGRERPSGVQCATDAATELNDCASRDRYLSVASGHTQFAFASASVTCVHHHYLPLWGTTPPWVPCATGYALAATTGALRIAADRHYFTDVMAGAVVGSLVGLTIPLLHYIDGSALEQRQPGAAAMAVGASHEGVTVWGQF